MNPSQQKQWKPQIIKQRIEPSGSPKEKPCKPQKKNGNAKRNKDTRNMCEF